jgi:di/tripeptidase
MIYVALAALVVIAFLAYHLRQALEAQIKEANDRERQTRTELLSVLGKTETVALAFNDQRPAGSVHYVDDDEAIQLAQRNG